MSNHPNRGPRGPGSTPTPGEVTALRVAAGLSTAQAAALLFTSYRAFLQWERGDRKIHPAFFELLQIKIELLSRAKS